MSHKLRNLRDNLMEELESFADRPINERDLEFVDKLSHSLKCIDTVCAMENYDGYSGRRYRDNYSYGNMGSRIGYGNLGRYSRDEAKDRLVSEMEGMMNEVSPEAQHAIQRAISALTME